MIPEQTPLTEEQKAALKKLFRKEQWRGFFQFVKFLLAMFLGTFGICLIDKFLGVNSQDFVQAACFLNGIYITIVFFKGAKKEHDRLQEEIKKILKQ